MRIRRTAVAALLAAGIVVPAVSAAAMAAQPAAKAPGSASAFKATPKPAKTSKAHKPVRFTASGTVTAVDAQAGTVTLLAKGGTKDVRKRTVTVVVPAKASLRVNGKKVTLSGVAAGQRIEVVGRRTGDVYTADVVRVSGKGVKPAPSPSVTPTPTTEPTTEPTDDPSDDPTDAPSEDPTVEPSAEPTV
ncbi:hypothetical protein [Nucisporomicrobium flavum]|uniref:hypothetical protein n=1 Tax=Nucisporomicrobium flavum TaxID=2785915 RepID=UPI0018F4913B|nr:hypothetical protein [Nucisporomicrobium flavum]